MEGKAKGTKILDVVLGENFNHIFSLAKLIPETPNPDFKPCSSLYYSNSVIKHFTDPSASAKKSILNLFLTQSSVKNFNLKC